ncbi:MAG: riboflavin synthase [Bacteroidetes bacterium]|nr:riboflavin synthase [Bacteroidota bacterium]
MFTGIIETVGSVAGIRRDGSNVDFTISSELASEFKIDQSVAHNGVCLTVVSIDKSASTYIVTAIDETLNRTNLGSLVIGDPVNIERCMQMNGRLDGHIVQGHVDEKAVCEEIREVGGSWELFFRLRKPHQGLLVEKGSITINGVSLTVVKETDNSVQVAIIPYTMEHTQFKVLKKGDEVNIEFDILGKYVRRMMDFQWGNKPN